MDILVSFLIFVIIVAALWYVSTLLPQPLQKIAQVLVVAGGLVWLITHIRPIIAAISGS